MAKLVTRWQQISKIGVQIPPDLYMIDVTHLLIRHISFANYLTYFRLIHHFTFQISPNNSYNTKTTTTTTKHLLLLLTCSLTLQLQAIVRDIPIKYAPETGN